MLLQMKQVSCIKQYAL